MGVTTTYWTKDGSKTETRYVGATLRTGVSVQVMSDMWSTGCTVWTGDRVMDVEGHGTVDATPEVLAAVRDWEAANALAALRWRERSRWLDAAEDAADLAKGDTATVARGRKVPLGTTGTVIWIGEDRFGGMRVGLKDADGIVHWTNKRNLDWDNSDRIPGFFPLPEAEALAAARATAERKYPVAA